MGSFVPREERPDVEVGEALELVFVSLTIVISLGLMVAFGAWWQR